MTATPTLTPTQRPVDTAAWTALQAHYEKIKDVHLRQLFADDPQRGTRLTAEAVGLYLDYSKNRVTDETVRLLVQLARERGVPNAVMPCFAARRLTSQRSVQCSTLRCVLREMKRLKLTA